MSNQQAAAHAESIHPLLNEDSIKDIGVLPEVAVRLNRMAEDPNVGGEQVAGVILRDPTLTSKILRIINSSFYGLRQEIKTVQHAVAYLGIHQVRNIALSSALIESFQFEHGVVDPRRLWEHSLGCAMAAKRLGDMLPGMDGDGVYLGGLLHDLGRIILLAKLPNSYAQVVETAERGLCSLREAEESYFGMPHEQIGYRAGKIWGFSEPVQAMIRYHHHPEEAERLGALAAIVGFANTVCYREGLGYGFEAEREEEAREMDRLWQALLTCAPAASHFQRDAVEEAVVQPLEHAQALVADLF